LDYFPNDIIKEWYGSLTEDLAEDGAAIFAEARAACVKRVRELHECVALVHGDTCRSNAKDQ